MQRFSYGMHIATYLLLLLEWTLVRAESASSPVIASSRKVVIGVDGGTESIRACCFDAKTGQVLGKSCAVPYETYHPNPGWAEQDPKQWYQNMGEAVRTALSTLPKEGQQEYEFCGICLDTTCCSVVALGQEGEPLRPSLLWMDARSAPQAQAILERCKGDRALQVNCGGDGPLSAEWMTPKALWIQQEEPHIWKKAVTICEYQDYMNFMLTGCLCSSSCNAAARWHWNGVEALRECTPEDPYPGRPISLYQKLGIAELADKLPSRCLPMGAVIGHLTAEAAEHLSLPEGLPVTQGGPDAFVGMIGLGCVHPGQLCLITGSSHLHCVVTSEGRTSPGVWGAYTGAPLPHLFFAEGGQSSTGSILRWAKNTIFGTEKLSYKILDDEASKIPAGSDGLVALETFQGSRTPVTDPLAKGALVGLTLSHTRAHIWRALCEGVCFGSKSCMDALHRAGHPCDEIVIAGGATRSPFWLQLHADIMGKPVVVCENSDAPLLGCAILASVSAGVHGSVDEAVQAMVSIKKRVHPSQETSGVYNKLYAKSYAQLASSIRPIVHDIASLRGGAQNEDQATGFDAVFHQSRGGQNTESLQRTPLKQKVIISPSLLAADWANIKDEVARCIEAGASRLHVDIFDGVFIDSPLALTFGPQMVEAIRRCSSNTVLDLHMCVDRPARYIQPMQSAGANTFIFMWEGMEDLVEAIQTAQAVVKSGMKCGVSINPSTSVEEILPLLTTGLISVVDVLAVEAGFGGQTFQEVAIDKVERLRDFRAIKDSLSFEIMVDGGINEETASKPKADILVAGTFLFKHPESFRSGIHALQSAASSLS